MRSIGRSVTSGANPLQVAVMADVALVVCRAVAGVRAAVDGDAP